MNNTYQWRDSYRKFYTIDPDLAGQALAEIEAKSGNLTAFNVVDAARPKRSPLHGAFEWDNTVAAESWRLEQARSMIKSIEIVTIDDQGEAEPVSRPVYFNVQPTNPDGRYGGGYYKNREALIESVEEWQLALQLAKNQLAGSLKALQAIEDLRPLLNRKQSRTLAKARKSIEAARDELALI